MPPLPVVRCHSKLMEQGAQSRSQDHLDCWLSASPDFLWAAAGNLGLRSLFNRDRFSRLVLEIVKSLPFEERHGEAPMRPPQQTVAFSGGKP